MKKINRLTKFFVVLLTLVSLNLVALAKNEVKELVCEYHSNPLGIDVVQPRLSWKLFSSENEVMQVAYEIRVADSPAKLKSKNLIWSTGKVNSSQSVNVVYGGTALVSMQQLYWQVRVWNNKNKRTAWSEPASWEMGILDSDLWKASWITSDSDQGNKELRPSPYVRKDFSSKKKISSARVYVTALGLYELFLNGQKVSTDLFTPGWTSYKNRIQYQTYDVTSMLKEKNTIGAILGDGWYRGNIGWGGNNYFGKKQALLCQLQINYTDGTSETILSDNSWKATAGPILFSDIYNGETYDAGKEMPGWAKPGFDDSKWGKVSILDHSKKILIAPQGEVVKAIEEIKPIKILTTPKGETVFDMGQNMVGWVKLTVNGKKGDRVTLKFAEVLDKDGNFYTDNLRKAKSTDVYILKGEGEEVFEPHFTFHGFRFLKLEGLPAQPTLNQVTGIVIHSDMTPTGSFTCSDPMINQLQHNIQWGQKGNFLDIPTDCPQRDERLGWTGDAQVFSMTAAFNFDVAPFYTKWMRDVAADQLTNGLVPHVIPDVLNGDGGSTAWADVALIVPWTTYLAYGDKRILEVQYSSMKGWVEYMKNRAGDDNLWIGDNHFGDWLACATTNSDAGVTDLKHCAKALEAMQRLQMPLLVHGEVTNAEIDVFDREKVFIDRILIPLLKDYPELKLIFEHITTKEAVDFVLNSAAHIAATITPHHLLLNRNDLLVGGIHPHNYCLPVLKRNTHQQALIEAATSGNAKFFLGTDSAPHTQNTKENGCGCAGIYSSHAAIELYAEVFEAANSLDKLEGFASHFGADFYQLSRNSKTITLKKTPWLVPEHYTFVDQNLVPMRAGQEIQWSVIN
ncbi:MAG: dihydroorotase [Labilibaculum sp.]|nr:dihydroorotase [Labilibaculum sp.]